MARRLAIMLAFGATLAGLPIVYSQAGAAAAAACQANVVRYEWNKRAYGAPWISAQAGRSRLEGYLYAYHEYLGDGRVNSSEQAVLRAGKAEKIAWFSTVWGGSRLTVAGRRLDGAGAFSQRLRAAASPSGFYPSGIRIPSAGCWQLTLRTEGWRYRVVVQAVEPASANTCEATPVAEDGSVRVVPARSGISAGWGWRTPEGGALLYTNGSTPEGGFTKVLWRSTRTGGQLVLRGTQLGGTGSFRQTFDEVNPRGYWPSTVVVPDAGCWLLTVRIAGQAGAAGIVVARVLPG